MRVIAAVPVLALLGGCAAGVAWPDIPTSILLPTFSLAALTAAWSAAGQRARVLRVATACTFALGGILLGAHAWQTAWRAPLKIAFESIAREQREQHRRDDSDRVDEDAASVVVVGVLHADAGLNDEGNAVGLSIDVQWVGRSGASALPDGGAANPARGRVLLTVPGAIAVQRMAEWRAGRRVQATALLKRPARYFDPGVPDQERVMTRRGITLVGSAKSGALVDVIGRGRWSSEWAAAARSFARGAIAGAVGPWSQRSAGIVTAIVVGDRTGLDRNTETRLQKAGTYHVIAISGGNIAILAGVTLLLFRWAGRLGRMAMVAAIAMLLTYGAIVGGSASVDRATLMATIYLCGRALDLRGPPMNVLLIVAGLLALADPLAVADPGFLLTFGATTSILVCAEAPAGRGRSLRIVGGMFVASLAAEGALFPVSAAFFSRVTFAGLALNFAAIPMMAIAQLAGMAVVLCAPFSAALAGVGGLVAHLGADGLVRSSALVEWAPAVTWRVPTRGVLPTAVYYGAALCALALWRRRRTVTGSCELPIVRMARRTAVVAAIVAAGWILCPPGLVPKRGDGRLHVTFFDVGQGDAALVTFPRGATMVIDSGGLPGGGFDTGDRLIAPTMRRQRVGRLDVLAFTHGDRDHLGGAVALADEFRPRDVWEGVPVPRFAPIRELRTALERASSRWTTLQRNDVVAIDGVSIVVHHPEPPDWERQAVRNEDSIVVELRWRDVSFVMTGDIGRETEEAIAARFAPAPLRVVKVPHHGSATSSTAPFIAAMAPTVAVISAGRGNTYGHPAKSVVDRYRAAGAEIFRTDRDGAIFAVTDGTSLEVSTHLHQRQPLKRDSPRNQKNTKPQSF